MVHRNCRVTFRADGGELTYWDNRIGEIQAQFESSPLRADTIRWLSDMVEQDEPGCGERSIRLLGRYLYNLAFPGEVRRQFHATITEVEAQRKQGTDSRLTLTLEFQPEAKWLSQLPWEFLYLDRDEQPGYLAGQLDALMLARVVRIQDEVRRNNHLPPVPTSEPLSVLLVTATPEGLPSVDADHLIPHLTELHRQGTVRLEHIPNPTYSELMDHLERRKQAGQKPWDVLHLLCHGEPGTLLFRRDQKMLDDDRAAAERERVQSSIKRNVPTYEAVSTEQVSQLTQIAPPRVAFLQACHSAVDKLDSHAALFSVAKRVVESDIPAVVAMQYAIAGERANHFAQEFYTELTGGGTIGAAVQAGRRKLAAAEGSVWATRDFGIPVIYLRQDDDFALVTRAPQPAAGIRALMPKIDGTPVAVLQQCPRCRADVRYASCGRCRWRMRCPNCDVETEYFSSTDYAVTKCYCGNCETEFPQPPWSGSPEVDLPGLVGTDLLPGSPPSTPSNAAVANSSWLPQQPPAPTRSIGTTPGVVGGPPGRGILPPPSDGYHVPATGPGGR